MVSSKRNRPLKRLKGKSAKTRKHSNRSIDFRKQVCLKARGIFSKPCAFLRFEKRENMVKQTERSDWQRCVDFHGHECGGLTIGYKAAQYAIKLLGLTFSDDEQVVYCRK